METDVAPDQQGVGGQDRNEQPTSEAVEGQVPKPIGRSKAHHRAAVYTSADERCPRCNRQCSMRPDGLSPGGRPHRNELAIHQLEDVVVDRLIRAM